MKTDLCETCTQATVRFSKAWMTVTPYPWYTKAQEAHMAAQGVADGGEQTALAVT